MKKIVTKISSAIILVATMSFNNAFGASFTALTSGNWSSAATWGSSAPSNNISSDQIHIPSGMNVTMDNDVTFNGALSVLDVQGTLSSTANSTLTMDMGSITGTGSITVTNVVMNSASALTFTGSFTVSTMKTGIASLLTTAHFMINQKMTMAAGVFTVQPNGNFEMGSNSTIEMAGGSLTSGGGIIALSSAYNVIYTSSGSSTTGTGSELSGSGLKDVTINTTSGNAITLQSDLVMNGTLNLTNGELNLNGHNMVINGDMASGGNATIYSTSTSNITINKSTSPSGPFRFSSNGHTVNNFTVNIAQSSGYAMMGSDLNINGTLNFMSGSIHTGDYNLDLGTSGTITGSGNSSYVMTGANGKLSMHIASGNSSSTMYPVGSSDHYTPAYIQLNSGSSSGSVGVGVAGDVWSQGTTGSSISTTKSMVKNTWHVYSDMTSNMNMNLEVRWTAAMEVNSFDRSSSYISHYTSGNWDAAVFASATAEAGGMYSMKRNNITSLSPFAVFDKNAATGVNETVKNFNFETYPNPVTDIIHVKNNTTDFSGNVNMDIINMMGQVVRSQKFTGTDYNVSLDELKSGNYFIRFYNNQTSVMKKFIKL